MYAICIYYFNYIKLIIIFIIFYIHEIWVKKKKDVSMPTKLNTLEKHIKVNLQKKKKKYRFEVEWGKEST